MANYNSIRETVANLHKDWTDDEIDTLTEDLYKDACESEHEQ